MLSLLQVFVSLKDNWFMSLGISFVMDLFLGFGLVIKFYNVNCYFVLSIWHLLTLESYNSIAKCLYLVDCNCSLIRQSFLYKNLHISLTIDYLLTTLKAVNIVWKCVLFSSTTHLPVRSLCLWCKLSITKLKIVICFPQENVQNR